MGICFGAARSGRVDASQTQTTIGVSKYTSSNSQSIVPSSLVVTSDFSLRSFETMPTPRTEGEILADPNLKAFTYNELRNATRNFRSDNLLGEGGFGYVYKAWVDAQTLTATKPGSGMIVAVKKLKIESFQGHKEWLTEVEYLSRLDHPNLVKLVGYCSEGENRLLVYEFLPKGSLENHLFRRGPQPLSWALRVKVAVGAARGLAFLHESDVIFRDFKASNILLDAEFDAKLSDFGLARAGPTGDRTHVSTQIVGTQGYAAPEYIATGRLTARCDVYSFGVLLVELLSGRRALDKSRGEVDQHLADWARPHLGDKRKLFRIMDAKLEGQYHKRGAHTVSTLAAECLKTDAKQRPKMASVLATLERVPLPKSKQSTKQLHTEKANHSISRPPRPLRSPMSLTPIASPRHLRSPMSVTPIGSPMRLRSPMSLTPIGSPMQLGSPISVTPNGASFASSSRSPRVH